LGKEEQKQSIVVNDDQVYVAEEPVANKNTQLENIQKTQTSEIESTFKVSDKNEKTCFQSKFALCSLCQSVKNY